MKIKKSDIKRLQRCIRDVEKDEAYLQKRYGAVVPRSTRARNILDIKALRRVLAEFEEVA